MRAEKVPEKDPQFQNAEDIFEKVQLRMLSVARESFTQIFYPGADGLLAADFLMNFADNNYNGEKQIREALKGKQKFTEDVTGETFRRSVNRALHSANDALVRSEKESGDNDHMAVASSRCARLAQRRPCAQGSVARKRRLYREGTIPRANNRRPDPGVVKG